MKALAATIGAALAISSPARAWGDRGHRTIADIAWTQLSPETRRQVRVLIAGAAALDTPQCPVGSLEDASTWSDCVRSRYRERYADTSTWHYVDVSECRRFALPPDPEGRFIVERLRREMDILGDRRQPALARTEALFWVAHLVGDLHQPLHVGDAGDRGGNEINVDVGRRYPISLHAEWDRGLVDLAIDQDPDGVAGIAAEAASVASAVRAAAPAIWARESWRLARAVAYPTSVFEAGCSGEIRNISIDAAYQEKGRAVVRSQLERAASRLAQVLNRSLAHDRRASN